MLGNSSKKSAVRHAGHNGPGFPHRGAFGANRGKEIYTQSRECRRHERRGKRGPETYCIRLNPVMADSSPGLARSTFSKRTFASLVRCIINLFQANRSSES